jgi:hypothetical protein
MMSWQPSVSRGVAGARSSSVSGPPGPNGCVISKREKGSSGIRMGDEWGWRSGLALVAGSRSNGLQYRQLSPSMWHPYRPAGLGLHCRRLSPGLRPARFPGCGIGNYHRKRSRHSLPQPLGLRTRQLSPGLQPRAVPVREAGNYRRERMPSSPPRGGPGCVTGFARERDRGLSPRCDPRPGLKTRRR